ncbi:uncharacterized protein LOC117327753 isoform X2 [Pecten maximus]|uniref:uncharacterized protein LOC117327753 isoform X2 n=1 Tax=Pecten maximus TaxID=6579 RepID=UPI001457F917|nr:uncharacterized protein LOC117327753 isoform X2 [Pecten maximus]
MDPIHKAKLKRNYVQIVIDVEPKDLVDDLYQDGILTDNDCERVTNSNETRKERCENLISVLMKRGPHAFQSFLGAIQSSNYSHIVDLLASNTAVSDSVVVGNVTQLPCSPNNVCEKCSPYFPVRFLNPNVGNILKRHCCLILQSVEPRDLLPYSYQEEIFSEDECERIKTGKTRKDRCALYLKELSKCRNDTLIGLLKASLQKKYHYIAETIENTSSNAKLFTQTDSIHIKTTPPREHELSSEISTLQDRTAYNDYLFGDILKQSQVHLTHTRKAGEHVATNCKKGKDSKNEKRTRMHKGESSTDDCFLAKRTRRDISSNEGQLVSASGITSTSPFRISPGASQPDSMPNKRLDFAFNTLVTLMNRGLFDQFNSLNGRLRRRYKLDFDMRCVLGYLQANLELHKSNFDGAKQQIESALTICGKTTNTRYFTLELLGTKARMLLYQKKFEKLQDVVDAAKMIIETDVVASSGRAAGWLHVQEGRLMAAQIDLLNPTRVNFAGAHHFLHKRAKASFEKALANFQKDKRRTVEIH